MDQHKVLPFYMTYPLPMYYQREDTVMRDLEYLQQMYPSEAKRYQKRIVAILDKMDYDGSVIYDEYPDRWTLYRMAENIFRILKQEEMQRIAKSGATTEEGKQEEIPEEKWEWIFDMIQILLFYEIYKRRHGRDRGFLKF